MAPSSILIVRLSAIGDVIHALPVLEAIRRALPGARIGWIVEELSAPLLAGHPQIDRLYTIPKKAWRAAPVKSFFAGMVPFFRAVRADGWEASIDMQGLSKSALASWAAGARRRVGFRGANAREISPLVYTHAVAPAPGDVHVVQQNLRLLEGLGIDVPADPPRGTLAIRAEEREAMAARLREAGWRGESLVAVNPGAGWPSKRWAPATLAAFAALVARRTGMRPLVMGGPGEDAWRAEITAALAPLDPVAAPRTTVRELAVLIDACRLFLGFDTGASHIAGVLGVPAVTIFGASDSARNRPWPAVGPRPAGVVLQRADLPCVPCWKTRCPLTGAAHMACLDGYTPERAMAELEPQLDALMALRP